MFDAVLLRVQFRIREVCQSVQSGAFTLPNCFLKSHKRDLQNGSPVARNRPDHFLLTQNIFTFAIQHWFLSPDFFCRLLSCRRTRGFHQVHQKYKHQNSLCWPGYGPNYIGIWGNDPWAFYKGQTGFPWIDRALANINVNVKLMTIYFWNIDIVIDANINIHTNIDIHTKINISIKFMKPRIDGLAACRGAGFNISIYMILITIAISISTPLFVYMYHY